MKTKNYIISFLSVLCVLCMMSFISFNNSKEKAFAEDSICTITFHYVGVDYEEKIITEQVPYGTVLSNDLKYVQSAYGYSFSGWDKAGQTVVNDLDVYAVYDFKQNVDNNYGVKKSNDGSFTLSKVRPSSSSSLLLETYNYYKDFELEFTIKDNNTIYDRGVGPIVLFGDQLKYFIISGYDEQGQKREGTQGQPGIAALICDGATTQKETIPDWFNAPMEARTKIIVKNNTFEVFVMENGEYVRPDYWPSAPVAMAGGVSTSGIIGFGFISDSVGSYTISDIVIKNLADKSNMLGSGAVSYDISENKAFEISVNTNSEIQSVWFGNAQLNNEQYSVKTSGGNKVVSISCNTMCSYSKYANNKTLGITVYTKNGEYAVKDITLQGISKNNIKFFDGENIVLQEDVDSFQRYVLPKLPNGSIGWYINGKKIKSSVIYPSEDMSIYAKYPTDKFNVLLNYRNIKNREVEQTIQVQYGTEFTNDVFESPEPYGYRLVGWDFAGEIIEDVTITASYELYSCAKDFVLDFNGTLKNENFVSYESLNRVTQLDENYLYATGIITGSNLVTNQKFMDFELNLDIVKYGLAVLGDNNIIISFGQNEQDMNDYTKKRYSIVISLNPDGAGSYYTMATLLNEGRLLSVGFLTNICDESKPIEFTELNKKNLMVDSNLSPDGKFVNLRLVVSDGLVILQSKYSDETEWKNVINHPIEEDVLGYVSFGYGSNFLNYSYILGIDNFSMKNLDGSESKLAVSTSVLEKDQNGVYNYILGSKDIKTDINFRMQAYGGTNVIIYNGQDVLEEISVDIIKEELYEIGEFVTFDKRVIGDIYNQYKEYAKNGTLRIDIVVLAELDWGYLPLNISTNQSYTIDYYSDGKKLSTTTGKIGDTVQLLNNIEIPEGKDFVCWVDEYGNEYENEIVVVDNIKLTAVFKVRTCVVNFINHDGTIYTSVQVAYGEKVKLPSINPIWYGDVQFIEWKYTDEAITKDMTIIGKWSDDKASSCKGSLQGYDFISLLLVAGFTLALKKKTSQNNKG